MAGADLQDYHHQPHPPHQTGIDILCDAAAVGASSTSSANPDALLFSPLSSILPLASSPPPSAASPTTEHTPKRPKTTPSTSATSNHICHICKRVYERADHLTRHLRSHENARPYACARCPKRFNRA